MRITLIAAAIAAVMLPAVPAMAQSNPNREYRDDVRDAKQDYRRDLRNADSQRDVQRARQEYRADVRDARQDRARTVRDYRQYRNYDYNRPERGQGAYYAENYYRDGRYYQPRRLGRNDRIYRGRDNRYYCRRSDGTTGLIVGGIAGGLLGNRLAGGGSRTLGTLLGGAGGALLGQSIDRGSVTCR